MYSCFVKQTVKRRSFEGESALWHLSEHFLIELGCSLLIMYNSMTKEIDCSKVWIKPSGKCHMKLTYKMR